MGSTLVAGWQWPVAELTTDGTVVHVIAVRRVAAVGIDIVAVDTTAVAVGWFDCEYR